VRPRTLWILLLLVAGLGAFVWFVERDLPGSDERAERAKRVLDLEAGEVSAISWTRDGERVALSRAGGAEDPTWSLTEPLAARADDGGVERLLDQLAGLEKRRTLESGEPGELGLDPPRAVLTVATSAGERRLEIGGAIPASDSMVVATGDGAPYYVVANGLWSELARPAGEWRSRDVFPGEPDDVARFALTGEGERVAVARRGDELWLEAPRVDRADEGTVSRFLSALTGLQVEEFVDDPDPAAESFGVEPPSGIVEVVREDGTAWKLELGAPAGGEEGGRWARAEGRVVRVADSLAEDLAREPDGWRSLAWATLAVYEIDAFEVRDADGSVSFVRVSGQWERDGEQVEFNAVSDLLYAITGTKAEALDAGAAVAGEPVLAVTLSPGDDEQLLEVFDSGGDRFPARTSGRETTLWLGGDRVRDIRSKLAAARAAESLAAPAADAEEAAAAVSGALD